MFMSRPIPPESITAVDARITFAPAPELVEWACRRGSYQCGQGDSGLELFGRMTPVEFEPKQLSPAA